MQGDHSLDMLKPNQLEQAYQTLCSNASRETEEYIKGLVDRYQFIVQGKVCRTKLVETLCQESVPLSYQTDDDLLCEAGLWNCDKKRPNLTRSIQSQEHAKIAFIILASEESVKGASSFLVLRSLLNALSNPHHKIIVHVDASSSTIFYNKVKDEIDLINLNVLDQAEERIKMSGYRLRTSWGGSNLVRIQLLILAEFMWKPWGSRGQFEFDFCINLSDSDYPLVDNEALNLRFKSIKENQLANGNRGSAFLFKDGAGLRYPLRYFIPQCYLWPVGVEFPGYQTSVFDHEVRFKALGLSGISLDKLAHGSQWWILSAQVVEWILTDPKLLELWNVVKYTFVPDETFFHAALQMSQIVPTARNFTVLNENKRKIIYRKKGRNLMNSDVQTLLKAAKDAQDSCRNVKSFGDGIGEKLFARKFLKFAVLERFLDERMTMKV